MNWYETFGKFTWKSEIANMFVEEQGCIERWKFKFEVMCVE